MDAGSECWHYFQMVIGGRGRWEAAFMPVVVGFTMAFVGCGSSAPPGNGVPRDGGRDMGGTGGRMSGTGGTNTGGSNTGGSNTGGANTGGAGTGGANTGGTNTGGADTGGTNTGGANTGGANTGGANTGGTNTGGANTGGANTGGANTGGAGTGGAGTGGAGTGGAGTGGAGTGGAGTGGSAPACTTPGTWTSESVPAAPLTLQTGENSRTIHGMFLENGGAIDITIRANRIQAFQGRYLYHHRRTPGATAWSAASEVTNGSTIDFLTNMGIYVGPDQQVYAIYMGGAGEPKFTKALSSGGMPIDDSFHAPPTLPEVPTNGSTNMASLTVAPDLSPRMLKNGSGTWTVEDGALYVIKAANSGITETLTFKGQSPQLDVDAAGNEHVLYADVGTTVTHYRVRPPGGAWSAPEDVPAGRLVVTTAGVPEILHHDTIGLLVATRTASGWVDRLVDASGVAGEFGVDKLGRTHVAYATANAMRYARISATGTVESEPVTSSPVSGQVRIDQAGVVRILVPSTFTLYTRCP